MSYGPEAIDELIQESGLSYPVTSRQIERQYALTNIDIDNKGQSIMVGELLVQADIDRFESEEDLHDKLEPLFAQEQSKRRTGITGTLKNTFLGDR